ncbi:preprotein translocase subunit SecF [Campylobacter mucosalis]|uniref:protein translocase subunit SecF n=1 Tax=Campylobacter mucosalis TaxID=202 RepID=UPI0004D4939E|nr:protein translocase subunit SecF [Campylobacter mucosalis]KEA45546.1 preprotein translocase subunit SecF [Campylobacter mucosalis]QKF63240.1 protein-export membrane protein SecF [Campylobacter mucosalis]
MQIFTKAKVYDFMRLRFASVVLSSILFFGSVFLLVTKGLNYGIDFSGGTLIQLKYDTKAPLDKIREALAKNETLKNASVTEFGSENEVNIRFSGSSSNLGSDIGVEVKELLKDTGNLEIRRVDIVGPKVGDELREKGLMAIFVSFGAVLIYIAFRFEWRFALAAVVTEIHDVVITIGAISLFNIDVNLDTLAAILTVLGYSLNDTIIIFDRIRENIHTSKRTDIEAIINESISQTLSRTILTSSTTLMVVLVLYFFGGDMINGFSFVLLVGIIIGTVSSIYIGSPFLIWLNFKVTEYRAKEAERQKQKKEREKERAMFEKGVV